MEWTDFLHAGANSGKLKVVSMIFWWVSSWKMNVAIQLIQNVAMLYRKNELWVELIVLYADCEAIIFG